MAFYDACQAHDKVGNQGVTRIYHLNKWQHHWRVWTRISASILQTAPYARGGGPRRQMYPLQIMDIPDWPFDKFAIDLAMDLNVFKSGNQLILTIINLLTGWPEVLQSPKEGRHHCLWFLVITTCQFTCAPDIYYLIMEENSRISLWMTYSNNLALIECFPHYTTPEE